MVLFTLRRLIKFQVTKTLMNRIINVCYSKDIFTILGREITKGFNFYCVTFTEDF